MLPPCYRLVASEIRCKAGSASEAIGALAFILVQLLAGSVCVPLPQAVQRYLSHKVKSHLGFLSRISDLPPKN